MRYLVTIFFTLSAYQLCCAGPKSSSVYVSVDLGGGQAAGGTGTIIAAENGKSLVLTCAHVVESAKRQISVTYKLSDGKVHALPATYLAGSSVTHIGPNSIHVHGPDLALLQLDFELPAVEIAEKAPPIGTPIIIYGFGGTADTTNPIMKTGYIINLPPRYVQQETKHSVATINGDSGAGVFDLKDELVAVHWGWAAVKLDVAQKFIETTVKNRKAIFPKLHVKLEARKHKNQPKSITPPIPWSDI